MSPLKFTDQRSKEALENLLGDYTTGHALPRDFYTSDAVYEIDIKQYWNKSWIWVGHISQLAQIGDYMVFEYGPESVIIVRDKQDRILAFQNICRHRGSRICLKKSGSARVFSCPYHAWTYELNGKLRAAREMGSNFNPENYHLLGVHLRVFEGLIFICSAENPPAIELGLSKLQPLVAPFQLDKMKIAHSKVYPVPANWKLALENYMECYHCAPAHTEYSRSHSLKDPAILTEDLRNVLKVKSQQVGIPTLELQINRLTDEMSDMDFYYSRYPLYPGYLTGSKTGAAVAPLLGRLGDYDGGTTDIQIGVLNNFLAYSDHVIGYRFVPVAQQETRLEVVWMVHENAELGHDYTLKDLTWLWDVTSKDDERIIRLNQKGVNSHHYLPGPLSQMEWGIRAFHEVYFSQIKSSLLSG